jgi:hypothetical protein
MPVNVRKVVVILLLVSLAQVAQAQSSLAGGYCSTGKHRKLGFIEKGVFQG